MTQETPLVGGMDPHRAPVRVGDTVRRAAGPSSAAVRALLRHLEEVGFDGAPCHLGTDDRGREILSFVDGDVPLPPYPAWSMTDEALADLGRLLRRLHDATASYTPPVGAAWAADWADPRGGAVICHNDLYPENVVFRDGRPAALIDFAMAAPGRPLWDLAVTAEVWSPLGDPSRRDGHLAILDPFRRLGILTRAYGMPAGSAEELYEVIVEERAHAHANVRAEIAAGDDAWTANWAVSGGDARWAADDAWIAANRAALIQAARG
jgi:hypothetical protein